MYPVMNSLVGPVMSPLMGFSDEPHDGLSD